MGDRKMEYDEDKIDECVLALMCLGMFKDDCMTRSWKGFDWDTMDRLYKKGFIGNPKGKARSVIMTDEGEKKCEELFDKFFGKQ